MYTTLQLTITGITCAMNNWIGMHATESRLSNVIPGEISHGGEYEDDGLLGWCAV
jgi:hypothetical protein